MKFPPEFSTKVDPKKVALDVFRPWVAKKVTGYLGLEDDIVVSPPQVQLNVISCLGSSAAWSCNRDPTKRADLIKFCLQKQINMVMAELEKDEDLDPRMIQINCELFFSSLSNRVHVSFLPCHVWPASHTCNSILFVRGSDRIP